MKRLINDLKWIIVSIFIFIFNDINQAQSYDILLKYGNLNLTENVEDFVNMNIDNKYSFKDRYYSIIQFKDIPDKSEKEKLNNLDIRLLDYIPNMAYIVSLPVDIARDDLKNLNIRSITLFKPEYKLSADLLNKDYPEWALKDNNRIELIINIFRDIPPEFAEKELSGMGLEIIRKHYFGNYFEVNARIKDITKIAEKPFTVFIESAYEPGKPENYSGRTLHRSNTLAPDYRGSHKYNGEGIKVMLQDDGEIGPHIDYQGRIGAQFLSGAGGAHGDHTGGTIMSAGNLDPKGRGMAYGAEIYVYGAAGTPYYNGFDSIPSHYFNPGIKISSTSYSNGCNAGYTSFSRLMDEQVRKHPSLMHVFSAGNSGYYDCGYGAGPGWGNVTGGHKIGKNVIAVGNTDYKDILSASSSRGPAHDGRIKPDVCAKGSDVYSTLDPNDYRTISGTSMACPGVAGSLAQLYHAYKELNGGTYPHSALMKAILLNTADDIGNPGPDYQHGWGRINVNRAVKILENYSYIQDSVDQGDVNDHSISVPPGVSHIRVMIYWNDFEASVNTTKALVNDLNMQLSDPASTPYNPWVLDPTPNPANLNAYAVRGIDDLNNVEQVTIDNPLPGIYTISVEGFQVPSGPQTYFVVYEMRTEELELTYPIGGESFVPGEWEILRWDAFGTSGSFNLEYSTDNGNTWNTIAQNISPVQSYYEWSVPTELTGQARVKVSRGSQSDISDTSFSIIGVSNYLQYPWACPDSFMILWSPVSGALFYEVSMLGALYMDSIGVSNTNSYVVKGVNPYDDYWLSVKAYGPDSAVGRRAYAKHKLPGIWNCPIPVDVEITDLISPGTGILQDCQNNTAVPISIDIRNNGDTNAVNIDIHYQINGGNIISETYNSAIAPSNSATYQFNANANFSSTIDHHLKIWTSYPNDGNKHNDTILSIINVVPGITVTSGWKEDFENFSICYSSAGCFDVECDLDSGWINSFNSVGDNIDWRPYAGPTPTGFTGPIFDHTTFTTSGKYLYLEPSFDCFFAEGRLVSPCLDLTSVNQPVLSFWYHMNGADMGELHLDIYENSQWTEDIINPITSNQGNLWHQKLVDLSQFSGQIINLRFRGITGNGEKSDIAIDDIELTGITSIENANNSPGTDIYVYPNPSKGIFKLYITNSELLSCDVLVMDFLGRDVMRKTISIKNETIVPIDISNNQPGVYFLKVVGNNLDYNKIITLTN